MDLNALLQAILAAIFSGVTAAMAAVIGPTYDGLVVPQLTPAQLFPPLAAGGSAGGFLGPAAAFSDYLVSRVVDPLIAVVAVGIGLLYLVRAASSRTIPWANALLLRFVVAVVLANFALPIASGILGLSASIYPAISGWDAGAWQHWVNLAGVGEIGFSAQNGALAFILSFVELAVVLLLALALALRDALLAVLLVLLPLFTIVWPLGPASALARRGWLLFVELAFLPNVLVVPLELAVGAPNPMLLVAYLTLALASPVLLSLSGAQLWALGFPSGGSVLSNGVERGLGQASRPFGTAAAAASAPTGGSAASRAGSLTLTTARSLGSGSIGAAGPSLFASALGQGAGQLLGHLRSSRSSTEERPRGRPQRSGAPVVRSGGAG